jgi:glucose-1-phosphate thymidylyltransferase
MKGVLLAGGTGSRLFPLTRVTNKHLLPVYDWPMIYYPLNTLKGMGITDVCVILGGNSVGDIVNLLGDGSKFGMNLTYRHQSSAGGIAHALKLAEDFCGKNDYFAVVLGDNVFIEKPYGTFEFPCIFIDFCETPEHFGVVSTDANGRVTSIEEKPSYPKSPYIQLGLYLYGPEIWDEIGKLKPSERKELEVTDLNNILAQKGILRAFQVEAGTWFDAGQPDDLIDSGLAVRIAKRHGDFIDYLGVQDNGC